MQIRTLFSGSRGNCTLIVGNQSNILIDCGMGYTLTSQALHNCNVRPESVTAILITHTHGDHIGGLKEFLRHCPNVSVYAHKANVREIQQKTGRPVIGFDSAYNIGDICVDFCQCYHDTEFCCGYALTNEEDKVCYITDTGCYDEQMVRFASGARTIVIESNHDTKMLLGGSYPYMLKKRIMSECGHLSNAQCAEFVARLIPHGTLNVILAHLSEQNNTPDIAYNCVKGVIDTLQHGVRIIVAPQWSPSEITE